jgi:hypothetical protein
MAGDWIAMRLDLYEDPAVAFMAERLGEREEVIVGFLHRVWSWASRQCHGGRVTNVTLMSLGRVTSLPDFPQLMVEAGWLEHGTDGNGKPYVEFPNWDRWMAESAKKRLLAAKRQSKKRHADVTKTSRIGRDKSVTTGEESTEDKSIRKEPPISPNGGQDEQKPIDAPAEPPPQETPPDEPPQVPPEEPVQFPESVADVCEAWLDYKRQRRQGYKPRGLKSFATTVEKAVAVHGAGAVRDALEQAMSDNYQGWTHNLRKANGNGKASGKTWAQQAQSNVQQMLAKAAADDAAAGRFGTLAGFLGDSSDGK